MKKSMSTANKHDDKRAVIYCRVSTTEQAKEGNSLITQERACREYAERTGYTVTKVFVDSGESAKTADRPELKEMLSFCSKAAKNNISAVIVYKLDRLARNTNGHSHIRVTLKHGGTVSAISYRKH